MNNKLKEILEEFNQQFSNETSTWDGKPTFDCKFDTNDGKLYKEVKKFIKFVYQSAIQECLKALPDEKEIFNKNEIGKVGTHAIASNINSGWNSCLFQYQSKIKELCQYQNVIKSKK